MRHVTLLFLLRGKGNNAEVLLAMKKVRFGAGRWNGVGGKLEPGESIHEALVRETHEEIGVDLTSAERLGTLDDLYPRTPVLPPVVVRPFVFALTSRPPIVLNPEVQDAFWVSFRSLAAAGVRGEVTIDHPGIPRRVLPSYTLGKHTIWGMSERILTPLITLVS